MVLTLHTCTEPNERLQRLVREKGTRFCYVLTVRPVPLPSERETRISIEMQHFSKDYRVPSVHTPSARSARGCWPPIFGKSRKSTATRVTVCMSTIPPVADLSSAHREGYRARRATNSRYKSAESTIILSRPQVGGGWVKNLLGWSL